MFDVEVEEAGRSGCAEAPKAKGGFGAAGRWIAVKRHGRRRRKLFQCVAKLDDRLLADIGITPFERDEVLGRFDAHRFRRCGG